MRQADFLAFFASGYAFAKANDKVRPGQAAEVSLSISLKTFAAVKAIKVSKRLKAFYRISTHEYVKCTAMLKK